MAISRRILEGLKSTGLGGSSWEGGRRADRMRIALAKAGGFYPFFHAVEEATAREVRIDGRWYLSLGSNNYLGLTHHPRVLDAAAAALRRYGSGSTGSRLLNGTFDLHEELEVRLADFLGKDAAIVFSAGYLANLGALSTLARRGDHLYLDRLDHASLVEAGQLSAARVHRYPNRDLAALDRLLARNGEAEGRHLVVTDGVFSMEGSLAELPGLCGVAEARGADVLVDDAHGFGVMGPGGRGTAHHQGVADRVSLIVATFSKSLASIGGVVAGSRDDIWDLKFRAKSFIFTASMPPASVATTLAAFEVLRDEPERRERLHAMSDRLRAGLRSEGYDVGDSETPVVPVYGSSVRQLAKAWKALWKEGLFAHLVLPPAVPADTVRIRLSLTAEHTDEDVDRVVETFRKIRRKVWVAGA